MNDSQIISIIENTLYSKIDLNEEKINYSFYELRVKYNLTEDEVDRFQILIKNKLENMQYRVYFTGQKYIYKEVEHTVPSNELIIAIKNS